MKNEKPKSGSVENQTASFAPDESSEKYDARPAKSEIRNPKSEIDLITQFYESFARGDAEGMAACYHERVEFSDPAFGVLKGADARDMWRMLVERSRGNIEIAFRNVAADGESGAADWTADYLFSKTGRRVFNEIHAEFEFRDGKIYRHRDAFDIWKWSRQALGLPGLLFGWSAFLQNKIRQNALASLKEYRAKKN